MRKIILSILLCAILCGCKHKGEEGSDIRPIDFPDFMTAPKNARNILYSTPQNDAVSEGTYSLTYIVDEEFPPNNTMSFIQNQLSSANFFRLKRCPVNLYEVNHEWKENPYRDPDYVDLTKSSSWGTPSSLDSVFVVLYYHYAVNEVKRSELGVSIVFSTKDSPYSIRMERYKEQFSEEFEHPDEQN
jgi:hypothetical protein